MEINGPKLEEVEDISRSLALIGWLGGEGGLVGGAFFPLIL